MEDRFISDEDPLWKIKACHLCLTTSARKKKKKKCSFGGIVPSAVGSWPVVHQIVNVNTRLIHWIAEPEQTSQHFCCTGLTVAHCPEASPGNHWS